MSIQLVGRARQAGLVVTPRGSVRAPDRGGACRRGRAARSAGGSSVPDVATGAVPLTPIMRWLLERGGPSTASTSRCCCRCRRDSARTSSPRALQALLDRHDVLRLRLTAGEGGDLALEIMPPGRSPRRRACGGSTCRGSPMRAARLASPKRRRRPRRGLRRPRARWCRRSGSMPARSGPAGCCWSSTTWRWTGCRGASCCRTWRPPGQRCARARRSAAAARHARSGAGRSCLRTQRAKRRSGWASWRSGARCWRAVAALVDGALGSDAGHSGAAARAHASPAGRGDGRAAHAGAGGVPRRGQRRAADRAGAGGGGWRRGGVDAGSRRAVLSTSRATAARSCSRASTCRGRWAGSPACSRCGSTRSARLDEALAGGPAAAARSRRSRSSCAAVPDDGLGYGLLRYLNPATAAELAALPRPADRLQLPGPVRRAGGSRLAPAAEAGGALGLGGDRAMPLAHALEVNAVTLDGPEGPQLTATWTSRRRCSRTTRCARWPTAGPGAGRPRAARRAARRRRAHARRTSRWWT